MLICFTQKLVRRRFFLVYLIPLVCPSGLDKDDTFMFNLFFFGYFMYDQRDSQESLGYEHKCNRQKFSDVS